MSVETLDNTSVINIVQDTYGSNKYALNESTTYNSNLKYSLDIGTYSLNGIPSNHPLSVTDISDSNFLTYTGLIANKVTVSGIDYYTGNVTIQVTGNFGTASIKCLNHGYMGGQDLFKYVTVQETVSDTSGNTASSSVYTSSSSKITKKYYKDLTGNSQLFFSEKVRIKSNNIICSNSNTTIEIEHTKNDEKFIIGSKPSNGTSPLVESKNGKFWSQIPNTIFTHVRGIAYSPESELWIACGSGTSHTLAYSINGKNWIGLGKTIFGDVAYSVAYANNKWVAVGGNTPNTIAYSSNGINWTGVGNTIFTNCGKAIGYGNGLWVAGGQGTNSMAYSVDAINWTGLGKTIFDEQCNVVKYADNMWVAGGGNDIPNTLAHSTDGINWTGKRYNNIRYYTHGVDYANGLWIAGGGQKAEAYAGDTSTNWVLVSDSIPDWNGGFEDPVVSSYGTLEDSHSGLAITGWSWFVPSNAGTSANYGPSFGKNPWNGTPIAGSGDQQVGLRFQQSLTKTVTGILKHGSDYQIKLMAITRYGQYNQTSRPDPTIKVYYNGTEISEFSLRMMDGDLPVLIDNILFTASGNNHEFTFEHQHDTDYTMMMDDIQLFEDTNSDLDISASDLSGIDISASNVGTTLTGSWILKSSTMTNWNGGFETDVLDVNHFVKIGRDDPFGGVLTGWTFTKGDHTTWGPTLMSGNNSGFGNQAIIHGTQIIGLRYGQTLSKTMSGLSIGKSYKLRYQRHARVGQTSIEYRLYLGDTSNILKQETVTTAAIEVEANRLIEIDFVPQNASETFTLEHLTGEDNIIWFDKFELYEDQSSGTFNTSGLITDSSNVIIDFGVISKIPSGTIGLETADDNAFDNNWTTNYDNTVMLNIDFNTLFDNQGLSIALAGDAGSSTNYAPNTGPLTWHFNVDSVTSGLQSNQTLIPGVYNATYSLTLPNTTYTKALGIGAADNKGVIVSKTFADNSIVYLVYGYGRIDSTTGADLGGTDDGASAIIKVNSVQIDSTTDVQKDISFNVNSGETMEIIGSLLLYSIEFETLPASTDSGPPGFIGWKKVFRQDDGYLWTSGSESSVEDNMKNNQLNTETDDNYSIMNEIYNSSTRDNYKYNGVYKFKMVNTQGYELIWTQTGNPFDHIDELPGTVSIISWKNFELATGAQEFDGLHIGTETNRLYSVLDGIVGDWGRYCIGMMQLWDQIPTGKIPTISTNSDHIVTSDWVELYSYVVEGSNYGSELVEFVNIKDGPLSTAQNWLDANHSNWNFNLDFPYPYFAGWGEQSLGSNYNGVIIWSYQDPTSNVSPNTGNIEFTAHKTGIMTVVYGSTWNNSNDSPVKLLKNDQIIEQVIHDENQIYETTFSVSQSDVIKIQEYQATPVTYSAKLEWVDNVTITLSELVEFVNIKDGPLSTAQNWLDANHPLLNIQLTFHTPYFGHVFGQYLSAPDTDDALVIWSFPGPNVNSGDPSHIGIVSFTAHEDSQITLVYGDTGNSETVKVYKNDVLIDETNEVKKTIYFSANKNDVIEIKENVAVMVIYSIKSEWVGSSGSSSNGSSDSSGSSESTSVPGWKKVFKQTVPYVWSVGDALDNMKNNQLNTESDDNYSIMNEIFNSSTRDNYKYNGVYKFKMVNTQGYELTWTQTGNPFDHTDEAPGTVSDISTVNFTLPTTEHDGKAEFGGLHVSGESQYAILEGALGHWSRYIIGQLWGGETLMTISTATAQATHSDWVELYAYVSDSGSGDSESTSDPNAATNSFILSGSSRSLNDVNNPNISLELFGSPTFGTNGVELTDTTSKYIKVPQSILMFGSNDFTISVSIKDAVYTGNTAGWILGFGVNYHVVDDHIGRYFVLGYYSSLSGGLSVLDRLGVQDGVSTIGNALNYIYGSDSDEHTFTISRKDGNMYIFVDNELKITPYAQPGPLRQDDENFIGGGYESNSMSRPITGKITKFEVWDGKGFDSWPPPAPSGSSSSVSYNTSPTWSLISDSITDWNGGFEADALSSNSFKKYGHDDSFGGTITGWTYTKGTHSTWGPTLLNGNGSAYGNQAILHGSQVIGLRYNQTLTKSLTGLTAGKRYKLSYQRHNRVGQTDIQYKVYSGEETNVYLSETVTTASSEAEANRLVEIIFIPFDTTHSFTIKQLNGGDIQSWFDKFELYEDTSGYTAGSAILEYPPPEMVTQIKTNNDNTALNRDGHGSSGDGPNPANNGETFTCTISGASHGDGDYTLQTSSNKSNSWEHHPRHLIDKDETSSYGFLYNWGCSDDGRYNSDGTVTGTASEKITGVNGEWAELTLPESIVPYKYYIRDRNVSPSGNATPLSWKIYGYNGSSYDLLDSHDDYTELVDYAKVTMNIVPTNSYSKILLIITKVNNKTWFGLGEFRVFGVAASSFSSSSGGDSGESAYTWATPAGPPYDLTVNVLKPYTGDVVSRPYVFEDFYKDAVEVSESSSEIPATNTTPAGDYKTYKFGDEYIRTGVLNLYYNGSTPIYNYMCAFFDRMDAGDLTFYRKGRYIWQSDPFTNVTFADITVNGAVQYFTFLTSDTTKVSYIRVFAVQDYSAYFENYTPSELKIYGTNDDSTTTLLATTTSLKTDLAANLANATSNNLYTNYSFTIPGGSVEDDMPAYVDITLDSSAETTGYKKYYLAYSGSVGAGRMLGGWVQFYYNLPAGGSSGGTTTTYNFWDHGLSTDGASGTTAETILTQWAAQFPIISSYVLNFWNLIGDSENYTTPGVRIHQTQQDLLDANYQNAVSLFNYPHGTDTGFVEFTFTETASCKLVYGGSNFNYLTGASYDLDPTIVYKNGTQIDSTTDIQKILTFDVDNGDVIKVWENAGSIFLYALEVTTGGSGDSGSTPDPHAATHSFILTGASKSLTDVNNSNISLELIGSPTFSEANGVELTGTNSQYIKIPQSVMDVGTNDYTLSIWIKNAVTGSGEQALLSMESHPHRMPPRGGSIIKSNSSGLVQYRSRMLDPATTSPHTNNAQSDFLYGGDANLHNYVVSRKGTVTRLFIDDVERASFDDVVTYPTNEYDDNYIGMELSSDSPAKPLTGDVTKFEVWLGTGYETWPPSV